LSIRTGFSWRRVLPLVPESVANGGGTNANDAVGSRADG